jgi:hypothetical protein
MCELLLSIVIVKKCQYTQSSNPEPGSPIYVIIYDTLFVANNLYNLERIFLAKFQYLRVTILGFRFHEVRHPFYADDKDSKFLQLVSTRLYGVMSQNTVNLSDLRICLVIIAKALICRSVLRKFCIV